MPKPPLPFSNLKPLGLVLFNSVVREVKDDESCYEKLGKSSLPLWGNLQQTKKL